MLLSALYRIITLERLKTKMKIPHWFNKGNKAHARKISKRSKRNLIGAAIVALIILGIGTPIILNNEQAASALRAGKKSDDDGHYSLAKQKLESAPQTFVRSSIKKQLATELARNRQLEDTQQKLNEAKRLLQENKPAEAQKILQGLQSDDTQSKQLVSLQKSAALQTGAENAESGGGSNGATGSPSGSTGTSSSGSSGGSPPAPGPLTGIGVVSFTASSSPATASTCNISGALTFSANGTGTVSTTWYLVSTKSSSQIDNQNDFTFTAAGNQSDSQSFSGTQGLEPGDSYRASVIIASASNPAITVVAGPITISSCAAPPALAAEQATPLMTAITPGTPTVYESQDSIFPNECSVQVTTPYSVNSSGTVEVVVLETSGSSIGYTYYDKNGVTSFNGAGSTSDTSYFRLPHLPGNAHYTTTVKLVEVSSPNTVFATTAPVSSACD